MNRIHTRLANAWKVLIISSAAIFSPNNRLVLSLISCRAARVNVKSKTDRGDDSECVVVGGGGGMGVRREGEEVVVVVVFVVVVVIGSGGGAPATRTPTRQARHNVFPEPGPAMTQTG